MTNDQGLALAAYIDPAAIEEYESRTLRKATTARVVDVDPPAGILTTLGPVLAVTYEGTLQGDFALYEHTFEDHAGPILMVDANNRLHLVGGDYRVSDLGIEDGEHPEENPRKRHGGKEMARMAKRGRRRGKRNPTISADLAAVRLLNWKGPPPPLPFGRTAASPHAMQGWAVDFPRGGRWEPMAEQGNWYLVAYPGRPLFCLFDGEGMQAGNWWPATHYMHLLGEKAVSDWPGPHGDELDPVIFPEGWEQDTVEENPHPYVIGGPEEARLRYIMGELLSCSDTIENIGEDAEDLDRAIDYLGDMIREMDGLKALNPRMSSAEARHREHGATTAKERHHWRRKKGEAMRRGNPVITNRISPESPVVNAGELAMAQPGGSPYGLPIVNAGPLAAAPNYPSDYAFPGVVNGSHRLLGPQVARTLPGQPIANPAEKKDGKWHRAAEGPASQGYGSFYYLHAGDVSAYAKDYHPRLKPDDAAPFEYREQHRQDVPRGTKWFSIVHDNSIGRPPEVNAHRTLKAAKRAAEKAMKGIRAR